eukprot:GEMP01039110.1.p1 GENE.GEMP01039110.1~~GEMP01039110.1.p1  ORF type:complete len:197 (+),score=61.31 GEMP01039110.1:66-656(+)
MGQSASCNQVFNNTHDEVVEQQSEPMVMAESEQQVAVNAAQHSGSAVMSENGDVEGSQGPTVEAPGEEIAVEEAEKAREEQGEEAREEQGGEIPQAQGETSEPSTMASGPSDEEKVIVENFLRKNKYSGVDGMKIKTSCNKKSTDYPLHAATKQNNEAAVKALLASGADKTKLNHQKKTAFQLATKDSPVAVLLAA